MTGAFQPTRRSTGPTSLNHTPKPHRRISAPSTPTFRQTSSDPCASTPSLTPFRSQNGQSHRGASIHGSGSTAANPLRSVPVSNYLPSGPPPTSHAYVPTHEYTPLRQSAHDNPETPRPPPEHPMPATPGQGPSTPGYRPAPSTPGAAPRHRSRMSEPLTPHLSHQVRADAASEPVPDMHLPPAAHPAYLPPYVHAFIHAVQTNLPTDDRFTMWTQKTIEIITHLANHRIQELEPFCRDSFDLYKQKYSRSQRLRRTQMLAMAQTNPGQLDPNLQGASHTQQLFPQNTQSGPPPTVPPNHQAPFQENYNTPAHGRHASDDPPSYNPNSTPFLPTQSQQTNDRPALRSKIVTPASSHAQQDFPSNNLNPTSLPNNMDIQIIPNAPPSLALETQVQPQPSHQASTQEEVRTLSRAPTAEPLHSSGTSTGVAAAEKSTPIKTGRKDTDGLPLDVCKRLAVEQYVCERQMRFRCALETMPVMTEDCDAYVIWQPPSRSSPDSEVILPIAKAHLMRALMDNSRLLPLHLDALRFLWASLVGKHSDQCGAVFYHGVGYPIRHLLLLFARLYYETFESGGSKRILVICTASSLDNWQNNGSNLFPTPVFYVGTLHEDSWHDDIKRWASKGGILLCTADVMNNVFQSKCRDESKRLEAIRYLIRPGPDIVVVDEASQISSWNAMALGVISSMQTPARLALTGVPFGGNLSTWFPVINWSCPRLLGTQVDFWCRYLRPVADAHISRVGPEQESHAQALTSHLWRRILSVSYILGAEDRRKALQAKGKKLVEVSIVLNLYEAEAERYTTVCRFLKDAISKNDMSRFIALNVLSALLFSKAAALRLIEEVASFRQILSGGPMEPLASGHSSNEDKDGGTIRRHYAAMREKITKVDTCLQRLQDIIEGSPHDLAESQKVKAITAIISILIENGDRVVLFVNSDAIRTELALALKGVLQPASADGETVFYINMEEPRSTWTKNLTSFNKSRSGAVLIAPYGVWEECMEDCGWAFVNATKVIVLDCCWSSSPLVQAIQRVHNFSPYCHVEVVIMYITVYGTVDSITQELLARNNYTLEQSLSCSVLVEPEITTRLLTYSSDAQQVAENVPVIRRQGLHHPWCKKVIERLTKLVSGTKFGLNTISVVRSQYDFFYGVLSGSSQKTCRLDASDSCDLNDGAIMPFVRNRLRGVAGEVERGFKQTGNVTTMQNKICSEQDFHEAGNIKHHGLLASWKKYYSLYEGGGLDKERLSKSSHPVVESDEHQGINSFGVAGAHPTPNTYTNQRGTDTFENDGRFYNEGQEEWCMDRGEHSRQRSDGGHNVDLEPDGCTPVPHDRYEHSERGHKRRRGSDLKDYEHDRDDRYSSVRLRSENAGRFGNRGRNSRRYGEKNGRGPPSARPNCSQDFSEDGSRPSRSLEFDDVPSNQFSIRDERGSGHYGNQRGRPRSKSRDPLRRGTEDAPFEANGRNGRSTRPSWDNIKFRGRKPSQ